MPGTHRAAVRSPRRWLITAVVVGLVAALVGPVGANSDPGTVISSPGSTPLVADGGDGVGIIVGSVDVENDADSLMVTFTITDPDWCIVKTHLDVFEGEVAEQDFVNRGGNPSPGKFDYSGTHDCVDEVEYDVPLDGLVTNDHVGVIAHAEVSNQPFCDTVPDMYGSERNGNGNPNIFTGIEVDGSPVTGTALPGEDLALAIENSPNGLAFDPDTGMLWYSVTQSNDDAKPSEIYKKAPGDVAGTPVATTERQVAGATIAGGFYWYIANATDDLMTIDLGSGEIAKVADIAENLVKLRFGDLVFVDGTIYGSAVDRQDGGDIPVWFEVAPDGSGYSSTPPTWPGTLQLAVDGETGTVYGHSAGNGEWFDVSALDGTAISLGGVDGPQYTDLASGAPCGETETAWGDGDPVGGNNWATWFKVSLDVCPAPTGTGFTIENPGTSLLKNQLVNLDVASLIKEGAFDGASFLKDDVVTGNQSSDSGDVCSWYLHIDRGGVTSADFSTYDVDLTFMTDVVGVQVRGSDNPSGSRYAGPPYTLNDPTFRLAGVDYPVHGVSGEPDSFYGLEFGDPQDMVTVSGKDVSADVRVNGVYHDVIRILVEQVDFSSS